MPTSFAFGKCRRLLTKQDYASVFDQASYKASSRYILVLAKPSETSLNRLGIIVSKKNAKRAVDRNTVKRAIRESFRQRLEWSHPVDMVVLAKRGVADLTKTQLNVELEKTWTKLKRKIEAQP